MEFVLPKTLGWSAMHLVNKDWGNIAVIVKREYQVSAGKAIPKAVSEGLVLTDTVAMREIAGQNTLVISREAETALFKTKSDILYLGRGTQANDSSDNKIISARLSLNGSDRRTYIRGGSQDIDPINLFGYEPRTTRIAGGYDQATFSFPDQGDDLFHSTRRSMGYAVPSAVLNLSGVLQIKVSTHSFGGDDTLADFILALNKVSAIPFVWEGGLNKPAYWCKRTALALTADTITINANQLSVIWRGQLPLANHPAADLRRITLKEVD